MLGGKLLNVDEDREAEVVVSGIKGIKVSRLVEGLNESQITRKEVEEALIDKER